MAINSKQKGARGEREFAKFLTDRGYPAERGLQFKGSPDSPDVICRSLPFHWEIKLVQRLNIQDAIEQAIRDNKEKKIPIVAHKKSRKDWLVTLRAEDFLQLLKKGKL